MPEAGRRWVQAPRRATLQSPAVPASIRPDCASPRLRLPLFSFSFRIRGLAEADPQSDRPALRVSIPRVFVSRDNAPHPLNPRNLQQMMSCPAYTKRGRDGSRHTRFPM